MDSSVIDLQNMITSPECDVVNLLRRAHVVSSKLELVDFDQWISYELNGYPNPDACPNYRKVRGSLRAENRFYGLVPVSIPYPEIEDAICEQRVTQSLSELMSLSKEYEKELVRELPGQVVQLISKICSYPCNYVVQIQRSSIKDISEIVKNVILEWTIELEKAGILGEGGQFSDKEKQISKNVFQTINNYYKNIINNSSESNSTVSEDKNINFSYDKAEKTISEIETIINKIALDDKEKNDVLKELSKIKKGISQKKKDSVKIKKLLANLEKLLLGTGKIVLATLIQIGIQHLFLH